jgi:hypothetical protein
MIFRVGIENNNDGRTIAWALEHPGCYGYGADAGEACTNLESEIVQYADWIHQHEAGNWLEIDNVQIEVEETFEAYFIEENFDKAKDGGKYMVESFFRHDWKPLKKEEIDHALLMLEWSRKDLIRTISNLSAETREADHPGERWSINGILKHIATAEWWYLERLGKAFSKSELDKDPLPRLVKTRGQFTHVLPSLEGVEQVVGLDGEIWSPRKSLRRALWHERDHTEHIWKISQLPKAE